MEVTTPPATAVTTVRINQSIVTMHNRKLPHQNIMKKMNKKK
jgi:mannose/fructose/N-acetylgalactosamine-specific phosphotransferase system component IIB